MPPPTSVSVIIPLFRGNETLPRLLTTLRDQSLGCDEIRLVETEPTDEAAALARAHDARHTGIERTEFDHAGTRSSVARETRGEVLVFLTQDALPASRTTLETLVASLLAEPKTGAAFGRQVPDELAHPVAAIKRIFNYPDHSITKSIDDRATLGLRTPFLSNAFAAYRRSALEEIGFFGGRQLICEDVRAGALLLAAGWAIRYESGATVHHTHDFGLAQELSRYFDIGVAHRNNQWILDRFGGSDRDGMRYLRKGIDHLRRSGCSSSVPAFVVRSALARIAYSAGRRHRALPRRLCRRLSSFPLWWDRPDTGDSE